MRSLPSESLRTLSALVEPLVVVKNVICASSLFVVSGPAMNFILATSVPFHCPVYLPIALSAMLLFAFHILSM